MKFGWPHKAAEAAMEEVKFPWEGRRWGSIDSTRLYSSLCHPCIRGSECGDGNGKATLSNTLWSIELNFILTLNNQVGRNTSLLALHLSVTL